MKPILPIYLLTLSAVLCHAEPRTITRSCLVSNQLYAVRWEFNDAFCSIPATIPLGQPHYGAKVTVFGPDGPQVGYPFDGEVTDKGCFEDVPEDMVRRAMTLPPMLAVETVNVTDAWWPITSTNFWATNYPTITNATAYNGVLTITNAFTSEWTELSTALDELAERHKSLPDLIQQYPPMTRVVRAWEAYKKVN